MGGGGVGLGGGRGWGRRKFWGRWRVRRRWPRTHTCRSSRSRGSEIRLISFYLERVLVFIHRIARALVLQRGLDFVLHLILRNLLLAVYLVDVVPAGVADHLRYFTRLQIEDSSIR